MIKYNKKIINQQEKTSLGPKSAEWEKKAFTSNDILNNPE